MKKISEIYQSRKFARLKRFLFVHQEIARENYRGERTIIILSGLNFNFTELKRTVRLHQYEEKFLFFLFLLRFSRTRIIYVISKAIPKYIIDYYINIISDDNKIKEDIKKRLIFINLNDTSRLPVAYKLLKKPAKLKLIEHYIAYYLTTFIRCYNSTVYEKKVAIELGVPLYSVDEKLSYYGTKSGSIDTFRKNKLTCFPSYVDLKSIKDLICSIAKLIKRFPNHQRLIIKIEDFPAGEGNVIFSITKFRKLCKKQNLKSLKNLKKLIRQYLYICSTQGTSLPHRRFSYYFSTINSYFSHFNKAGGIVELYSDAPEKTSPSCQVRILPNGIVRILSTHEQVLGGKYKTEYAGCLFPANKEYRRKLTSYSYKIAKYLAQKGVIGRFAVDFLAVKYAKRKPYEIFPIEINMRKGGTTHPYELTRSVTGATYNKSTGLLNIGKKHIYYYASDNIGNPQWKGKDSRKLITLLQKNNLNFNKNTKSGVIIYLFSSLPKDGRFGATFIAPSKDKVQKLYRKTIRTINRYL